MLPIGADTTVSARDKDKALKYSDPGGVFTVMFRCISIVSRIIESMQDKLPDCQPILVVTSAEIG
jgi:hypothetical protein